MADSEATKTEKTDSSDRLTATATATATDDIHVVPRTRMVTDMRHVAFIGSSGINFLVTAHRTPTETGGRLRPAATTTPVTRRRPRHRSETAEHTLRSGTYGRREFLRSHAGEEVRDRPEGGPRGGRRRR